MISALKRLYQWWRSIGTIEVEVVTAAKLVAGRNGSGLDIEFQTRTFLVKSRYAHEITGLGLSRQEIEARIEAGLSMLLLSKLREARRRKDENLHDDNALPEPSPVTRKRLRLTPWGAFRSSDFLDYHSGT